jgi:hypothetical protein
MDARDLEVRCSGCGAGFAVGTRRCIHCGLPLGPRSAPAPFAAPGGPPAGADPDTDDSPAENARLNGLLSGGVMLAVVLGSALLRACN